MTIEIPVFVEWPWWIWVVVWYVIAALAIRSIPKSWLYIPHREFDMGDRMMLGVMWLLSPIVAPVLLLLLLLMAITWRKR